MAQENIEKIEELKKAFYEFNKVSESLEQSYNLLKEEVVDLKLELKQKDKRLSDLTSLLETVIMSMSSGLLAVDENGNIMLKNNIAERLLGDNSGLLKFMLTIRQSGVFEQEFNTRIYKINVDILDINGAFVFIYLFENITSQKSIEKDIQRDERLKLMGAMAANIAHEIRNPLGSLELYASLLHREVKLADHINLVDSILKGIKTINTIVSNVLIFNREINIDVKKHYVADLADDVILYIRHLIIDKKINFINHIQENDIIYCDEEYFKQVIMNLLHNSIEAVKESGTIKIESFEKDEMTSIIIEDNGCGIKKEYFDRLFIPFQTNKPKGTGLGLAISYKIIKEHGGKIIPESDGSSFTKFTLEVPKRGPYKIENYEGR
jgi:two-component system sensor histidine kinase FlrB